MITTALLFALGLHATVAAAAPPPEPALPTSIDVQDRPFPRLHYARVPMPAFTGELRWDQVIQGQVGSCFFLASLAAVAKTHPRFITRAIRRSGDGVYAVTLSSTDGTPVVVTVDDLLPATDDGAPFFARGKSPDEWRPALFEKAFAQLDGGYEAINGGEPADALRALTGRPAKDHPLAGMSDDAVWALLGRAEKTRRPAVASTPELPALRRLTDRDDLAGLIEDHVYAFLGRGGTPAARTVRLYTPLSPRDAGDAPDDRRRLDLNLHDFARYFESVTVGDARE